jgi:multicomponent Na+:H+ antiporter subunit D
MGTLEAGQVIALGVFVLSGLLNAGYFLPIVIRAFFFAPKTAEKPKAKPQGKRKGKHASKSGGVADHGHEHHEPSGEASPWMVAPLCFTALLALVFGLFPNFPLPFFDLATQVVEAVITSPTLGLIGR